MAADTDTTAANNPTTDRRKRSLQEREVHRYYEPWQSSHGSSLNVADCVDSLAKPDLRGASDRPQASRDKTLAVFAQLATLRLGVTKGMVSLMDAKHQYIIADFTPSTRLDHAAHLGRGTTILARTDAICEHAFWNTAEGKGGGDGITCSATGLVVNNCKLDARFKDLEFVRCEPGVRFFAGVPIVTRGGIQIGVYAATHDQPRDGLTADELVFMQETAQAVMEHLEWARDRVDRYKGDRIVRGMASFIEGCASLGDEALDFRAPVPGRGDSAAQSNDDDASAVASEPEADYRHARRSVAEHRQSSRKPSKSPLPSSSRVPPRDARVAPNRPNPPARAKSTRADTTSSMFARAADILRDSTLADGAAIFAAFAGPSSSRKSANQEAEAQDGAATLFGQPSPGTDSSGPDQGGSDSDTSPNARPCKVLAFALADDRARADIEQGSTMTLGTLEKYFQSHPRGKVFYFTEEGSGLSSEDESGASGGERQPTPPSSRAPSRERMNPTAMSSNRRKQQRHRMDPTHKEFLKKIPGAKSVVFLPLYDLVDEKLMAGCFLWTSVYGRMITMDDDLSYLRAFGNSIMSEVARINIQKNEAAKTTFIASMSHELRSPLHGILGAAEFLVDTATDSYQAGLITSISTCGKTLLDTLNHVLDYSKINKLGRAQMRKNAKQNKLVKLTSDSSLESMNMTAEVDLGMLIEEVVEAITAGHAFKELQHGSVLTRGETSGPLGTGNGIASVNGLSGAKDGPDASEGAESSVSIMLDISPRRSWLVRTQPGALRRIIMNLLGNSLKYTTSGFVAVSLRAQEKQSGNKMNVIIRVVDSGQGMSDDFQRDRMFVAFSQEDTFQPGTGLGLSIVKQIVDSLGGSVEVKSEQRVGTEVEVHLTLAPAESQPHGGQLQSDDMTRDILGKVKGLHMVLLDACQVPGQSAELLDRTTRLQESLREVCEHWFNMRVTISPHMDRDDPDIFLYAEPPSIEHLLEHARQGRLRKPRTGRRIPIIMICLNAKEAVKVSRDVSGELNDLGTVVEVIPQPCGPRKLAKVLGYCMRRVEGLGTRDARDDESHGNGDDDESQRADTNLKDAKVDVEAATMKEGDLGNSPGPASHPQVAITPRPPLERRDDTTTENMPPMSAAVAFPSPAPLDAETPSLNATLHSPFSPSRSSSRERSSLHVLLVDDNKINIQLLTMFMKKSQYSYAEAENGLEALEAYRDACLPGPNSTTSLPARRFDYVLMDINMPVMNGLESTKRIRDFERENGLRRAGIIALTGLASKDAQREAETAGVDVFMAKPVKFAELKRLLVVR